MYHIVQSNKTFDQAAADLETAVQRHGFGILHVHNLGNTLRSKGHDFAEECKVFEICHPGHAAKVLSADIHLNMALPCRISVFTENGQTLLGMIKPAPMLTSLSQDTSLAKIAQEVETKTAQMLEDAK